MIYLKRDTDFVILHRKKKEKKKEDCCGFVVCTVSKLQHIAYGWLYTSILQQKQAIFRDICKTFIIKILVKYRKLLYYRRKFKYIRLHLLSSSVKMCWLKVLNSSTHLLNKILIIEVA